MQWKQLVSPNLNPVVYQAGKALLDWYGYCLATVESAFGTPHLSPTAWAAWEAIPGEFKHADRNFPVGVYFCIWFSGYNGMGHVAIVFINSSGQMCIWTSPYEHIPYFYAGYHSVDALATGYKVTYVGWSEMIAGIHLCEQVNVTPPAPTTPSYTISPLPNGVASKQVQLNKSASEWNLNYATFAEVAANPFSSGNAGDIKTVTAVLQPHNAGLSQYQYYLENAATPVGWNTLDCADYTDYTPPPPPTPVVPPVPPAGALQPMLAQKYTLLVPLPYYASEAAIANSNASSGTLPAGTYYVWSVGGTNSIYYNLTTDNTKNMNQWVNVLYNKVPPKPVVAPQAPATQPLVPVESTATIRASYRSINADGLPVECLVKTNVLVTDIVSSGSPITVKKNSWIHIYGTFKKGDQWYAMPKIKASNVQAGAYMYGVPITNDRNFAPYLDDAFGVLDYVKYGVGQVKNSIKQTIDGFFKAKV